MSRFTGPLAVLFYDAEDSNLPNSIGRIAVLMQDLCWEMEYEGSDVVVTVPKGFVSDGASVPWFMWWLMPPWGDRATRAAILHDYLRTMISDHRPNQYASSWRMADRQFYLALRALGVGRIRAGLLWLGTRIYSLTSSTYNDPVSEPKD